MHAVTSDYKLQSMNNWLQTTMSGKSLPSWLPQETLKQKYLQHSYHVSFMFLASYSHGSSSPTAAMCVIVNSMANSFSISVWWSHVSQVIIGQNFSWWRNQQIFLSTKYRNPSACTYTLPQLMHTFVESNDTYLKWEIKWQPTKRQTSQSWLAAQGFAMRIAQDFQPWRWACGAGAFRACGAATCEASSEQPTSLHHSSTHCRWQKAGWGLEWG